MTVRMTWSFDSGGWQTGKVFLGQWQCEHSIGFCGGHACTWFWRSLSKVKTAVVDDAILETIRPEKSYTWQETVVIPNRVVQSSHFSATFCQFSSKRHKSEFKKWLKSSWKVLLWNPWFWKIRKSRVKVCEFSERSHSYFSQALQALASLWHAFAACYALMSCAWVSATCLSAWCQSWHWYVNFCFHSLSPAHPMPHPLSCLPCPLSGPPLLNGNDSEYSLHLSYTSI